MKYDRFVPVRQQAGASTIAVLIAVLFFGSLLTLVIKLGPVYLDDYTIQEALEGLRDTDNLATMNRREVRTLINKRLSVNNVSSLDSENVEITQDGERVLINVNYEVRTSIFANVDAVVSFSHAYDMDGQ